MDNIFVFINSFTYIVLLILFKYIFRCKKKNSTYSMFMSKIFRTFHNPAFIPFPSSDETDPQAYMRMP